MNVLIFLTFNLRCCCSGPVVFCIIKVIQQVILFSCLFFNMMKSLKSLSRWSLRNRKAMISFKRFVARARLGSEN